MQPDRAQRRRQDDAVQSDQRRPASTSGRILFEERDISRLPTRALARLGIARTFQNLAVFKHETVVENLLVGMHAHLRADPISAAVFWSRARERIEEITEFLEIERLRDQIVGTLSYILVVVAISVM
jgi:branched-chain amino acid transport system ATP-binding protein